MRSQSIVFPLHPELFQVETQCQKIHFSCDIGLPSGQKTAKFKVGFQQAKGTFHLNGPAFPYIDAIFGGYIFLRLLTLLPKCFLQPDFLWLFRIPCMAARFTAGTVPAVLTAVP